VTEDLSRRVISLPFFTTMTEADIDHVVGALTDAVKTVTRLRHHNATLELAG
jgi:dTDP-4-amino-4,6-dideoxygalactose transaminase